MPAIPALEATGKCLSRRDLLRGAAAGAVACVSGGALAGSPPMVALGAAQRGDADLLLSNGKFVDGRGHVATTLTIEMAASRPSEEPGPVAPDAREIDLGGRTVVPGLFDAHVHYTRAGVNPGYEARRIERAFSIAELQEAIATRATVGAARRVHHVHRRLEPHAVRRESRGRRRRSWMRRRRSTPSTFPAPAEEPARSRTASAARSSPRKA